MDPRIRLGIGVVDVKVNHVETAEEIARRIECAEKVAGPGRVGWVHPDCGFWMLKRSVADRKIAALVKGRDLYLGADERRVRQVTDGPAINHPTLLPAELVFSGRAGDVLHVVPHRRAAVVRDVARVRRDAAVDRAGRRSIRSARRCIPDRDDAGGDARRRPVGDRPRDAGGAP